MVCNDVPGAWAVGRKAEILVEASSLLALHFWVGLSCRWWCMMDERTAAILQVQDSSGEERLVILKALRVVLEVFPFGEYPGCARFR